MLPYRRAHRIRPKTLLYFHDHHDGDGRLCIWCPAAPGRQEALVVGEPEHYFRPPYVGHRGWIGVHLDHGLDWNEIEGVIEDAYALVAHRHSSSGRRPSGPKTS